MIEDHYCQTKKRDLYYKNPNLYTNQTKVDDAIENIACSLGVPRRCLNVIAGSKGLVFGQLLLRMKSGSIINCNLSGDQVFSTIKNREL
jgi:DNA topoisomerase VI subunit A